MRRFCWRLMMCGAAAGAQAADLPDLPVLRGGLPRLTIATVNWQGCYVGGQVCYGSVTSKVPSNINGDMQATFIRPANVDYNWQPSGNGAQTRPPALARSPDTTRSGTTWSSVWRRIISMTDFARLRPQTGLRYSSADNVTLESLTHSAAIVRLSDFGSLRVRARLCHRDAFCHTRLSAPAFGSQNHRPQTVSASPRSGASSLDERQQEQTGLRILRRRRHRRDGDWRPVPARRMGISSVSRRTIETNINTVRVGLGYKF